MRYTMYQVTQVGLNGSPWELLAKSEEHAIATVNKFYPMTRDKELIATQCTFLGEPITLVHKLNYGDKFAAVVHLSSKRPALSGAEYIRGDFSPIRNEYQCTSISGHEVRYFNPYTKIVRK